MPRILVALDGSPDSTRALEVAVELARKDGEPLLGLAVLDRTVNSERLAKGIRLHSRPHLERVLQAAVGFARCRGVQLVPLLREGPAAETILTCARQEHADLVVMGSHHRPAPPEGAGTADEVQSHARCPVLLVK